MLSQVKRKILLKLEQINHSLSSCLNFGESFKKIQQKIQIVMNDLIFLSQDIILILNQNYYLESKYQEKETQIKRMAGKLLKKQLSIEQYIKMTNQRNQKIVGELKFLKFNNSTLRQQINQKYQEKINPQSLKHSLKSIQGSIIKNAENVCQQIDSLAFLNSQRIQEEEEHENVFSSEEIKLQEITIPIQTNSRLAHIQQPLSLTIKKKRADSSNNYQKQVINIPKFHIQPPNIPPTNDKCNTNSGQQLARLLQEQTKIIQTREQYFSTN